MKLSQISIGQDLPKLSIDITARQIVAGAIASQDFEDVHHDKAAANAKGTPDIFMNILTTNGLVGRYLSDWAGSGSIIKRIKLKLGAPNFPGDTMVFNGTIEGIENKLVEISFKGKNGLGNHVVGSAFIELKE